MKLTEGMNRSWSWNWNNVDRAAAQAAKKAAIKESLK
jgi:hypothetical protein